MLRSLLPRLFGRCSQVRGFRRSTLVSPYAADIEVLEPRINLDGYICLATISFPGWRQLEVPV